jgi:hypothetical protein
MGKRGKLTVVCSSGGFVESNFIIKLIRRSNRNQLILWGLMLCVVLTGIALSINQFYNLLAGPFAVDTDYIEGIQDVQHLDKFYVTVEGQQTFDTEFSKTRTTYFIQTGKSYYKTLALNDHLLLVKSGDPVNQVSYSGALQPIPSDEQQQVVNAMIREKPNLQDAFLPFMMEADEFRLNSYAGLAAAAIGLIGCLLGILWTMSKVVNHERHPFWRELERFGEPASIADQIDSEIGSAETVGKARITRNWLVVAQPVSLGVIHLKDVMWIYKGVIQKRSYGIATGKDFSALVYDRYGKVLTINGKEAQIDETLRGLTQRMPWIVVGYSTQTQAAWTKDRTKFIAAVDQRKKQAASQ